MQQTNKNETALLVACIERNTCTATTNGNTCLHSAVRYGVMQEVLQAIIDHSADVNATNKQKHTALYEACLTRRTGLINTLLKEGADPSIADTSGNTCLHEAVTQSSSKAILLAIIDHGAVVNATNQENETALLVACIKRNTCIINILLNAGADPNIAATNGNTCLHYAADNDIPQEIVQAIIDHGADVNATNKTNQTALLLAYHKGKADIINTLLNAGADPNIAVTDGNTCLHYAAQDRFFPKEAIRAAINKGANVNATNHKNQTVVLLACKKGNTNIINMLLDAGADPNVADTNGYTCLHATAYCGVRQGVFQAIIDHGVDVNATNKQNQTALLVACTQQNTDLINTLLNAGADPSIADTNGDTCLHQAVTQSSSKAILQAIIDHGAEVNATNHENQTALLPACKEGNTDLINTLLNAGADPSIADTSGDTCLHKAVTQSFSKAMLQEIIDHGAELNVKNNVHQTALARRKKEKKEDAIHVLLNAGGNPNIANKNGNTCLHEAVTQYFSTPILQAIINHGAEVNATNHEN